MRKEAVLIFGLDGATWKLLNPWIKKNKLPFLAATIKKGVKGRLESTLPPLTSTAWASFQTGVSPSRHGVLGFQKTNGKLFSARDIRQPSFWDIAGESGKKCAIINLPLTFPPQPLNGYLVTSFLTPPKAKFTYPPHLQNRLEKGGYQIDIMFKKLGFAEEKRLNEKQKQELARKINRLVASREKAAGYIIGKKDWDIFFVLFKATDTAQHFFWKGEKTLAVYQKIDQAMKNLTAKYQKQHPKTKVNILIISDHGFHPVAKKDICFYPLLRRMGLLPPVPPWWLKFLRGVRKTTGWKPAERLFPRRGIKIMDWGVYWPTAGREKINRLAKKLSKQTLAGEKIFSRIALAKKRRQGRPALFWLTNPRFAPNADPLSEKLSYPKKTFLKAHHHSDQNGIFIAAGPNIKKTKNPPALRIFDLAPNILRMVGIAPPRKMEGKLFPEIFSFPKVNSQRRKKPPKVKPPIQRQKSKNSDKTVIMNRLRALGYVD